MHLNKIALLFINFLIITISVNAQQKITKSKYFNYYLCLEQKVSEAGISNIKPSSSAKLIKVGSQDEFDRIKDMIEDAVKSGETEIVIFLDNGPFYYKDIQIDLKGFHNKEVSLQFVGNNTKIISKGKQYRKGQIYHGGFSIHSVFLDNKLNDVSLWSGMYQSDGLVEIVDEKSKMCRVSSSSFSVRDDVDLSNAWLQLTEWYMSGTYKIQRIDGHNIYFTAADLKPGLAAYGNYNVNYDYTVLKQYPRFRVCNVGDKTSAINIINGKPVMNDFYECIASSFLKLDGTELKKLEVDGISFFGNSGKSHLLCMKGARVSDGINIHHCEFHNIKAVALYMWNTSNTKVTNCRFDDCYDYAILTMSDVYNTTITDNFFCNIGKGLKNSLAILCQSSDYYIARNEIVDFGYGGIGVGIALSENNEGKGIVEDNILFFTDEYARRASKNSLSDGGAIYINTKNNGTIVRYNRIHNYTGANSNRGIYCDDGAFNFSIYGNVITGIPNCNYIDSRLHPQKNFPNNTNNVVMYNIVEGRYKFEGKNTADNGCVKGQNIVLSRADDAPYNIVLNNFDNPEEDVYLEYYDNKDLKIVVPRATRKQLRKLPFYGRIKKYIKVK